MSCMWRGVLRNFHVMSAYTMRSHLYSASFHMMQLQVNKQAAGNRNDNNTGLLDARYQFSILQIKRKERAFDLKLTFVFFHPLRNRFVH